MPKLYLLFISLLLPACLFAQMSKKKIELLLTNGANRKWRIGKYEKTLGKDCTGAWQLFVFSSDGTLQHKRCRNNQFDTHPTRWNLSQMMNGI